MGDSQSWLVAVFIVFAFGVIVSQASAERAISSAECDTLKRVVEIQSGLRESLR